MPRNDTTTMASRDPATGVDGLDEVLAGGFPRGRTTLLFGETGTGKTTIGLQFLLRGVRDGERGLYIGMAFSRSELEELAGSHGWKVEGLSVHEHWPPDIGEEQTVFTPSEVELSDTVRSLLSVIDEVRPSLVVIDSLNEIRALSSSGLWYRHQVISLKRHLEAAGITALLTARTPADREVLGTMVSAVIELSSHAPDYGPVQHRLRAHKIRTRDFPTGYHDYRIRPDGVEVYARLENKESTKNGSVERMSTGLDDLDSMLGAGLMTETTTLMVGGTGTGKSLLTAQMLCAAADRGEPSVLFEFDERLDTLFERTDSLGIPLREHAEDGTIKLVEVGLAQRTCGEFSRQVHDAMDNGARIIALDSVNGYSYSMPEEGLLDVHLHELIRGVNHRGVTLLLTLTQHGDRAPHISDPMNLAQQSDTIITSHFVAHDGERDHAVAIYKHRPGKHETAARVLSMRGGLRIGKTLQGSYDLVPGTVYISRRGLGDGKSEGSS